MPTFEPLPASGPIPLSPAWRVGDFVYTSGQLAIGPDRTILGRDIETQTRACLDNLKAVLERCDCALSDVFKTTVWLTRTENFQAFNKVYAEYFPNRPPARSTLRAELMAPAALIEIEAIAYRPE